MSLYLLLGVPTNADISTIQRAHREALATLPVTRWGRFTAWLTGRSLGHLNRALAVLADPERRAHYDRELLLNLVISQAPPGH
jgi:DnaJ-class molecular chaperone